MPRYAAPVKRAGDGRYRISLDPDQRQLLRELPNQLRALLADPKQPSLRRLFPPAYQDNLEAESEYQRLMHDELLESRRAALETLERTADTKELSESELLEWLSALNSLRLVLGTILEVTEEDTPEDADSAEHAVYFYLGLLEEYVVEALAGDD